MTIVMKEITASEFRANQGKYLSDALGGQQLLLKSRYGRFKIVPVLEDETLTSRICESLKEVKLMREGKLKGYTVEELLNEL
jgi:hypothetical protein